MEGMGLVPLDGQQRINSNNSQHDVSHRSNVSKEKDEQPQFIYKPDTHGGNDAILSEGNNNAHEQEARKIVSEVHETEMKNFILAADALPMSVNPMSPKFDSEEQELVY